MQRIHIPKLAYSIIKKINQIFDTVSDKSSEKHNHRLYKMQKWQQYNYHHIIHTKHANNKSQVHRVHTQLQKLNSFLLFPHVAPGTTIFSQKFFVNWTDMD